MKTINLTGKNDGLTTFNITTDGDVLFNCELTPNDNITIKAFDDFYPGTVEDWKNSVRKRALKALELALNLEENQVHTLRME
jgi:hypothetical protein